MSIDLIIHSANQVLTLAGNAPERGAAQGELAIIRDGAVAISGEKIVAVGDTLDILALADASTRKIDARGKIVLPGFIDAHTHAVFAGDRANEFEMRLQGAAYLDIQRGNRHQHLDFIFRVETIAALDLRRRRAVREHRVQPRARLRDQSVKRRGARGAHRAHNAAAGFLNVEVRRALQSHLEFVRAVAGEDDVRVRVDERG